MKSGNFHFLEPSGPLQVCNGAALPFFTSPRWGYRRVQVLKQTQTTPRKLDQVVTLLIFKHEVPLSNLGLSTQFHEVFLDFLPFSLYSSAIVPEIVLRILFFLPTFRVVGYYYNLVVIRCIIVRLLTALLITEHKEIRT